MLDKDISPIERAVVRLRISDKDLEYKKQWLNLLKRAGCNIISIGRFGLDVEMDKKSISELLGLTLVLRGDHHSLEFEQNGNHNESISVPDAYIPTKPIKF